MDPPPSTGGGTIATSAASGKSTVSGKRDQWSSETTSRRMARGQRDDDGRDWITPGGGAILVVPTPSAYNLPPTSDVHWPSASAPLPPSPSRLFHLPWVQMQAGGGSLRRFNAVATSSTSLASKHEPEVDFSAGSTLLPPPSHPNVSRRWFFFAISSMRLQPPPPPSRPNVSERWFFQLLQRICTDHHLPRVQTRAGGDLFRCFNASATITTPSRPNCCRMLDL